MIIAFIPCWYRIHKEYMIVKIVKFTKKSVFSSPIMNMQMYTIYKLQYNILTECERPVSALILSNRCSQQLSYLVSKIS